MKPKLNALSLCIAGAFGCGVSPMVLAGATLDGSTGSTGSFSGNMVIPDTVGDTRGANLFHSFSDFSVRTGESATFTGPAAIDNVITRVTGGEASLINGPLVSEIPTADFYFLNPNGVLFGEGAQLGVDGAFYASTANYLRLGSDGVFYADLAQDSTLTTSPPSAFGFLGPTAAISLQGTQLLQDFTLDQPAGATLSLVGGDIRIDQASEGTTTFFGTETSRGSYLSAPGNRIELVSTASAGEAARTAGGYDLSSFDELGDLRIAGNSVVAAREVYIHGGQLVINQGLTAPGFFSLADMAPPPDGGAVVVAVSEDAVINGTAPLAITVVNPSLGEIRPRRPSGLPFQSGIITFGGSGQPDAPSADVPDIRIAGGDITISGIASVASDRFGPGNAADIRVAGGTVEVSSGGVIGNLNFYSGAGGSITVDAEHVDLNGAGTSRFTGMNTVSDFHPLFATPPPFPTPFDPSYTYGDSGNIAVNATGESGLVIRNGAIINTESKAFGRAGDVTITASDVNLTRDGASRGSIASQSLLVGNSGDVIVDARGTVTIRDGFEISATTAGTGDGGSITVSADGAIDISGANSGIFSASVKPPDVVKDSLAVQFGTPDFAALLQALELPPDASLYDALAALESLGLILLADPPEPGDAGPIVLTTAELIMSGPARIDSSTTDNGEGGAIVATLDSLTMADGAQVRSRSGGVRRDTGQVDVGTGSGGVVDIAATGDIDITGTETAVTTTTLGEGAGGAIELSATNVHLADGGRVAAESTGTKGGFGAGNAGSISVNADNRVSITGRSASSGASSNVSTSTFGDGDAGQVLIQAGEIVVSGGGRISSESGGTIDGTPRVGTGAGGAVTVTAVRHIEVAGSGSNVSTSTFGDGAAGQVAIQAGEVVLSSGGRISSGSGGTLGGEQYVGSGAGGAVSVNASGDIDITGTETAVTTTTLGEGAGGAIELSAANVYLAHGGAVSAESLGTEATLGEGAQPGNAGDIYIAAAQDFENIGGSVTTEAIEADGGNIKIDADGTIYLFGGDITTSVLGAGGTGGNIDIDPEFVVLQGGSNVLANATNPLATQAGNIFITGDFILISSDSLVQATGPTNDKDGQIIIRGPDGELIRALAQLPESYLDAAGLLRGGCGAAQAGLSSLVLAGRGGVPAQPSGYVPSYDLAAFGLSGQRAVAKAGMPNMLVALGPKDPTATGWLLADRGCR